MKTLIIKTNHEAYTNTRTNFSFGELVFRNGVARIVSSDCDSIKAKLQGFLDFSFEEGENVILENKEVEVKTSIEILSMPENNIEVTDTVVSDDEGKEEYRHLDDMSVVQMWEFCASKGWDEKEYRRFRKPEYLKKHIITKLDNEKLL